MRPALASTGLALILLTEAGGAQVPPVASPAFIVRLTEPQDDYPVVSPDGRRVLFQSNRTGSWQLWAMNRDGSGLKRVTTGGANDRTPDWSPDGNSIIFSSDRDRAVAGSSAQATRSIYRMDVRSGFDRAERLAARLVESPTQDIHPKWTPDGRSIVFSRLLAGGERNGAEVMIMDSDGGNVRRIPLPDGTNTYASLAPRGTRLVYRGTTKEVRDGRESDNSDLFSAEVDGSDLRRLTEDPAFDGWPSPSPDGRTIAFASRRSEGIYHIHLMPLAGGTARQITFGPFHHTQPAWSPDGRYLLAYRWTADSVAEVGHIVSIDLQAGPAGQRPVE